MEKLLLVKDFKDYKFVYYWVDDGKKKVSPDLPTLQHAEDWFKHQCQAEYEGAERRRKRADRRQVGSKKQLRPGEIYFGKRDLSTDGRRKSDRPIEVNIDLSIKKLELLKTG